jgi:hypothetical protein
LTKNTLKVTLEKAYTQFPVSEKTGKNRKKPEKTGKKPEITKQKINKIL